MENFEDELQRKKQQQEIIPPGFEKKPPFDIEDEESEEELEQEEEKTAASGLRKIRSQIKNMEAEGKAPTLMMSPELLRSLQARSIEDAGEEAEEDEEAESWEGKDLTIGEVKKLDAEQMRIEDGRILSSLAILFEQATGKAKIKRDVFEDLNSQDISLENKIKTLLNTYIKDDDMEHIPTGQRELIFKSILEGLRAKRNLMPVTKEELPAQQQKMKDDTLEFLEALNLGHLREENGEDKIEYSDGVNLRLEESFKTFGEETTTLDKEGRIQPKKQWKPTKGWWKKKNPNDKEKKI